ncbi:MAG TPA: hypothetical protein VE890_14800, partial [Thermoguttaceae bacterium]|nr:hypothetical protein [Thermoguttaceae bacterium]
MKRLPLLFAMLAVEMSVCRLAGDEVRVSHCYSGDTVESITDRVEPRSPRQQPHHSFWPHHGTEEWAEYHFDEPRTLSATEIYWLDDTPGGGCPVPERWRLFYRKGDRWITVENTSPLGVEKGVFNRVTFEPVETSALRIEVKSRPGHGSGIMEWDVRDDPQVTRAREVRRLLRPLEQLGFEPPESTLIDLIRRTEGFSTEAVRYCDRLARLKRDADRIRARIESGAPVDPEHVTTLASKINELGAEQVAGLGPIVFFTRYPLSRPNAANCYIWQSVPERWGCSIRVYDSSSKGISAQTIFADAQGSIFDMNLSRDAKTLFFSFKRQDEPCWQLYEIGVDGRGLRKISRDPTAYEVGAVELPDGDLIFVSTRRCGYTVCQPGPTSNLYVMHRDGSGVRCVSQNTLTDLSPHLLGDGRVLFTRWEYIDRDLTYRQSLWTQNPDGRRYQLFFGNTIRDIATFWQCRPVPGHGNLVVSTFAPHHSWPHGAIGLVQNRLGPEAVRGEGFVSLTPDVPQTLDQSYRWSYRDPYPLSDYQFLVAYGGGDERGRFTLELLDICGNRTPVYEDLEMGCYGPIPIRPRPMPPMPAPIVQTETSPDEQIQWGTVLLADVTRGLSEIEPGRIRYVQIMEQMRKMADLSHRAFD